MSMANEPEMGDDEIREDLPPDEAHDQTEEPEHWHELVICPSCRSEHTRFIEYRDACSIYLCENCGISFQLKA